MKERILISACLLGVNCRYAGDGKLVDEIEALMERYELVPVCPEQLGGLPTPRPPSERIGERVVSIKGDDVTAQFSRGAQEALKLSELYNVKCAILKERSPSCGSGRIYDGSFSGTLTDGSGMTAELLKKNGIMVIGESQIKELLKRGEAK